MRIGFPCGVPHTPGTVLVSAMLSLGLVSGCRGSNAPTGLLCELMEYPEQTVITDPTPEFGWVYQPSDNGDQQTGFRIIVASERSLADQGKGDVWDSGVVEKRDSINVPYAGTALQPDTDYFWRVQTLDGHGDRSPLSVAQHFHTATQLADPLATPGTIYHASTNRWANRYPLRFVEAKPVLLTNTAPGRWFIDFGQDAFGYVTVRLTGDFAGRTVEARFGERASGSAVNTRPGGSVRYGSSRFPLKNGDVTYEVRPPDISGHAIDIRPIVGVVLPFRYLELIDCPGSLSVRDVTQRRVEYQFNDNAATFDSSSPALNRVWKLCHYSMKATSFAGVYVDGDRERKPYEADAYINQLSHYAVDREFTLARYSHEYLLAHPTWPFEWKFHSILLAWADYLHTGNDEALRNGYDKLRSKLFLDRTRADGLLRGFPGASQGSGNSDIVDWPGGERDGCVIEGNEYSAINNAFFYRCLQIMSEVAKLTGRTNDAADFAVRAAQVYASYNKALWDDANRRYVDGVGIAHSSAHANFFPLAFGLVPRDRQADVVRFLHTRGMAPSVYGAQYLLEGLFEAGDADYAIELMTTNGQRGWLNMLNIGSTITTEAWDFKYKPNMDWNHAWGAAPGNIIARYVLGLRALEAGFGHVLVQPQLGKSLTRVKGTIPTIRGPFAIEVNNAQGDFRLRLGLPGNVTATVMLPTKETGRAEVVVDGATQSGTISNGWLTLQNIGSGHHNIRVRSVN